MPRTPPRPLEIFTTLARHGVEFVVVGGTAGVLHGAPLSTWDVEIVHDRSTANVERLVAALGDLGASYRDLTDRRLPPNPSLLRGPGHHLFRTRAGDLDVLGTIAGDLGYEELASSAIVIDTGSVQVKIIALELLIDVKEKVGRDKDRLAVLVLRQTLRLIREKKQDE